MSPTHSTTTPSASTSKTAPPCTPTGQTTVSPVSQQSSSASSPAPVESEVLAESQVPDESDVASSVLEHTTTNFESSATSSFVWSPPPNSLFADRVRHPITETPICHVDYQYDTGSSTSSILVISAADVPEDIPASNLFEQEGGNTEPYPVVEGTKKPIRRSWYSSSVSPTPLDYLSPERLGRRSSPFGSADEEDSSSTSSVSSPTTPRASTTIELGAAMGGFGAVSADRGSEESEDQLAGDGSGNGETSAVFPTSAVPPAGFLFGIPQANFFGQLDASVFAVQSAGQNGDQDHLDVDADGDDEQTKHVDGRGEIPAVEEDENHHDAAAPAMGEEEVEEEALDMFAGTKTVKRAAPKQLSSPKKKSQKLPDVNEDDAEVGEAQQPEENELLDSGAEEEIVVQAKRGHIHQDSLF